MAGSFVITNSQAKVIVIEQLHINLWHIQKNNNYIDIGINFYFEENVDIKKDLLLEIKLPYQIDVKSDFKPQSLSSSFSEENIKLIFNNAVKQIVTYNHEWSNIKKVELEEGEPFFLINPRIESFSESSITLKLNPTEIERIIKDFGIENHFYLRIRYKSTISLGSSVLINSKFLSEKLFFDFRFNELRHIPNEQLRDVLDKHLAIKNILIFLILPSYYKLIIGKNQKLKYIRLLEKGSFTSFFPALNSSKEDFIVYYWNILTSFQKGIKALTSHDELFAFEYDRNALKKILTGILSLLIIILILNIDTSQIFKTGFFSHLNRTMVYVFDAIKFIFTTVGLGALGSGLWDLTKSLLKRFKNK